MRTGTNKKPLWTERGNANTIPDFSNFFPSNPYYSEGVSGNSMKMPENIMSDPRAGGGGRGGGSEAFAVDPMDTNRFVEMNLNPYLTDNIYSFKHGGRVHDMYNHGGRMPKYADGGTTHTMPDGTVHPGATHEDYITMMGENKETVPGYNNGGMHQQQSNEMIAMNQISNLMGGMNSLYTNNQQPPMANNGMKIPKYANGGQPDYSVGPYESPEVSLGSDGGAEKNRINKIRASEWKKANGLNPYHVQFTNNDPRGDSSYTTSYKAELEKRRGSGGFTSGGSNPSYEEAEAMRLKNPWEEGYDNWYQGSGGGSQKSSSPTIDRQVLTRYDNGGAIDSQFSQLVENLQKQMPNPQDAMSMVSKLTGNQPMANQGMKMRKRYTQGGRF